MSNIVFHKYEKAKFWTDSGILFCEFYNKDVNHKLSVETVKKYIETIKEISKGKSMPFLIDVRNSLGTFSIAAAELFANSTDLKRIRLSEAFIVNSINVKLLISSYKRIYEPITPFQFFNNKQKAIQYCIESKRSFYADKNRR